MDICQLLGSGYGKVMTAWRLIKGTISIVPNVADALYL
jgi:hypothetical protein